MESSQQSVWMQGVGFDTRHSSNKSIKDNESNDDNHGKEELKSFAQDTTLHGARFLFVENIFRRLFWAFILIASISYCIYQVCTSMKAYYERPFTTKISTITSKGNNELLFPAVSLCNLNALNTRRYRSFAGSASEKKLQDISLLAKKANEIFKPEFVKRNPELFRRLKSRLKSAAATTNIQGQISHQIGEMLLPSSSQFNSCSINGIPCTAKNFTSHMSSAYGQCYTFNSADSDQPLLNATMAGQTSGLKLRLNIERDSYLRTAVRPTEGLAIIIHDQKSFPFMEEFGIAIQPGISNLYGIKRKKMINLPLPYATNCTNRSLDMLNSDAYVYTKQACLIKCRNDYTVKQCGCTPPEFKANASICSLNDTVFCVYYSYEQFGTSTEKVTCEQNCPEPCEYVEYEISFSYSRLQTETLVDHLMNFLNDTENTSVDRAIYEPLLNMTTFEREKYIEKNILFLDIYFKDISYEVINQTPVYETWTMIGNLGGTFGLFLGMSLLTILEFLDFIFSRICHLLQGRERFGKRKTRTIHVEN